jgi:hypothetical protein
MFQSEVQQVAVCFVLEPFLETVLTRSEKKKTSLRIQSTQRHTAFQRVR